MEVSVSTSWMLPNKCCWVDLCEQDLEKPPFIKAKIQCLSEDQKKVSIIYENPESHPTEVPISQIYETNEELPDQGMEDMVNLGCLNEPELANNLAIRYSFDKIFTYIGPTLLVINPYKPLNEDFSEDVRILYEKQARSAEPFSFKDTPPHVYASSALAYKQLFENDKNQALVISGESGAGKTENAKYSMKFLTSLSTSQGVSKQDLKEIPIEEKILSCNPVLEAFGNAKTVRNDNSSRFGKYVRILVEKFNKKIQGAAITNYLLEKSRVTIQSIGERNYHIFYHFLKGGDDNLLEKYHLTRDMNKYEYLNKSECYDVSTINDKVLFSVVQESFETMNFQKAEVDSIYRILSAILFLGNFEFDDAEYTENNPCIIKTQEPLKLVAELLQVKENELSQALLVKTRSIGKQNILSPQPKTECISVKDALARNLYDKLFNWLVKRLNFTIIPKSDLNPQEMIRKSIKNVRKSLLIPEAQRLSIGLLDIFGFENFKVNSLEQFCINYTNEKLQQLYIQYIFKSEEKEFLEEGLGEHVNQLNYMDNQGIIDLFDKYPLGIFNLLDESTALASNDDKKLLEKIVKTHKDSGSFKAPKAVIETFAIQHSAKLVEYNINGFRNKNKDELSKEIQDVMIQSQNKEISNIFKGLCGHETNLQEKKQGNNQNTLLNPMMAMNMAAQAHQSIKPSNKNEKFLGAKFRQQMKDLMDELLSCDVNFIRCIKPNELKQKDCFIPGYVLLQIRYLGVLESIKIRKKGYPIRKEYRNFYLQYQELNKQAYKKALVQHIAENADFKLFSQEIVNKCIENAGNNEVLFGSRKIYLRSHAASRIDQELMTLLKVKREKSRKIFKQFAIYKIKQSFKAALKKIHQKILLFTKIQAFWKRKVCRKAFLNKKLSIKKLGKAVNKRRLRKVLTSLYEKIIEIRKWEAKKKACARFNEQNKRIIRNFLLMRLMKYKSQSRMKSEFLIRKKQEEEAILLKKKQEEEALALKKRQEEEAQAMILLKKQEEEAMILLKKQEEEALILKKKQEEEEAIISKKKQEEEAAILLKKKQEEENILKKKQQEQEIVIKKKQEEEAIIVAAGVSNTQQPTQNLEKNVISENDISQEETKENLISSIKLRDSEESKQIKSEIISEEIPKSEQKAIENQKKEGEILIKKQSKKQSQDISEEFKAIDMQNPSSISESLLLPYVMIPQSVKRNSTCFFLKKPTLSLDVLLEVDKMDPEFIRHVKANPFMEYCQSVLPKRTSWGKPIPISKIMSFSTSLSDTITSISNKEEEKTAKRLFKLILDYCSEKNEEKELLSAEKIIEIGFKGSIELRDELFFLLAKQITNNFDEVILMKLFILLAMVSSSFPVSARIYLPILNFLLEQIDKLSASALEEKEAFRSYAKLCVMRVYRSFEGKSRKYAPSKKELTCIQTMQQIMVPISLANNWGKSLWIPVESYTTVSEAKGTVLKSFNVGVRGCYYGLFLHKIRNGELEETLISEEDIFLDIIAVCDQEKEDFEMRVKAGKQKGFNSLWFYDYKVVLKLKIYYLGIFDLETETDGLCMAYAQHQCEVLKSNIQLSELDVTVLASLALYINQGPLPENEELNLKINLEDYIPRNIRNSLSNGIWLEKIGFEYQKLAGFTKYEAMKRYLDILSTNELFLAFLFPVEYIKIDAEKNESPKIQAMVAVKPKEILFVDDSSKKIMNSYAFRDILRFGVNKDTFFLLITEDGITHFCESNAAKGINYMINAYINLSLGRGVDYKE